MKGLSAAGLADLAGVTEAEVSDCGPWHPGGPRRRRPVPGGRCAEGPPGHRVRAGRGSRRPSGRPAVVWVPGGGLPALGGALGADLPAGSQEAGCRWSCWAASWRRSGSLRMAPDGLIREDELELDAAAAARPSTGERTGPAGAAPQGVTVVELRKVLAGAVHRPAGGRRRPQTAREQAAAGRAAASSTARVGRLPPTAGAAWIEQLVEEIAALGADRRAWAGPGRVPAMCFWTGGSPEPADNQAELRSWPRAACRRATWS